MLLLAVMWGLSIPITKLGLETVPPLMFTAMRFLVAVPLLLILASGRLRVPLRAVPSIIALGVMGITLGNVAQSFGVQGTSASVGTIVSATIPIFIVIFAAFRLGQPVAGRHWVGLLAAFGGIALVAVGSGSGVDDLSKTTVTGVAWMLASAVAIAFYYIWSAELTDRYGILPVAAWNALAGLVTILPLAAIEMANSPYQLTVQALWTAVYLGVMVTVAGLLLWLYILRVVPARVAASVQYLQPVFGIAAASLMFGDRLGVLFVAGVIVILVGLALAVSNKRSVPEGVVTHA
ncbi:MULTISPECIES: DMT family transporter [unclassified Rhizobium]|uniref:DMT family transporter n=1 Tax=unclassified Rhizobium TaxID=2613769 RepID=UPI0007EB8F44|nr:MULTISPECIES: DMT family transporter [unclassified Rhizobium]ANM11162.1 DMT superfamily inner membrane transporter protein [Rhizobium sp. N324]ANM17707.1 DMT superfamily inner membrane transporter protein [Rhizobium sp. N541]ANM24093.1 DMT superfamily inner membrane transporter protein [Rhizobium sp. N941]OYD04764.1 DMT superfamily inner membrane transporter protein [Rhizobium sp. N4311]